jgi:hypothetical protein
MTFFAVINAAVYNRGFKKLHVWQDAISLYILAYKIFANFPFELKKIVVNSMNAAHNISRNIRHVLFPASDEL